MSTTPRPSNPKKPIGLSRRTLVVFGLCVVIAALAIDYGLRTGKPGPSLIGGPFRLQSAEGKTVTEADFQGHPYLIYFGYTHCPDVCPTTLAQISDVLKRLPDLPVKVLFVTVDPERDTPKLMADYVSSFDPRIVGLSGDPDEIAAVEKAFRVYARKAPEKDGDYAMDHSSIVYLMNAKGDFVEAFNLERMPEEAAKELKSYF
jgi:protein SCO1/2